MKTKPDLGFWKLWNLSFGFFGVQIAYALQSANVSRIFTTIGADPHDLSYFWILPPLMGLLVQPVVGMASDRTWTRFGRRLPYLILGATLAVIVMCLLPNAGSFHFSISGAILFGLVALMLLDTSINMAMQPFKMLVGDMVNEKQKAKAYSIQSFLCNAGSVMGFVFPFVLGWLGMKNFAATGVVPDTVIWSFYIGAAILLACVIYSLIKIKEWPPALYNEYNGIEVTVQTKKKDNPGLIKLLINAPKTFWTVGLVQFFCWFAFLFLWTYATNTVSHMAFNTPETTSVVGINYEGKTYSANYLLINNNIPIVDHGHLLVSGLESDGKYYEGGNIIINGNDTVVWDHHIVVTDKGMDKVAFNEAIAGAKTIMVDTTSVANISNPQIRDYLSTLSGPFTLIEAGIMADRDGQITVEDSSNTTIQSPEKCSYETKTVLNSATPEYNKGADWVGILYAVQALGSVAWALLLPRFKSRKFSYSLSLALAAGGFIMMAFVTNPWILFIAFILIGCGWAAMLAWPFTILTNSLTGGNIGSYLGLFNCTICIPQIVAALVGGWILSLMSKPGELAPENLMMLIAGIAIGIGALCVFIIKEKGSVKTPAQENPVLSEEL